MSKNCFVSHNRQKKHGFTLIELVLFIGLFTIILGVLTNLFSIIVELQSEVQSTSAVENDSKYITSRLMYDIQRADEIGIPNSIGDIDSSLTLTIDGIQYAYALSSGDLQLTVNSDTNSLNSTYTEISAITFERFGNIGGRHALQISYTINSNNETAAGQESKVVETMIGLR